jgi:Abnormal spindle-like microcephaly-assoc'd, ASPM-SPD-2-Hydin
MQQRNAMPYLQSSDQPWQPVGPMQIVSPEFGDVTGRITSIAIAPWDASGNTVYIGSTGGGVWKSTNAAANEPATVTFTPLTDNLPAFSGVNVTSLSIGAISVQPGTAANGVVLAGTGDPNDVLDSYYGAGILRSPDGGTTWRLITESNDGFAGGVTNYSFVGDAFSGFAWSSANPNIVVAAVTDSYDGFLNNINNSGTLNTAEAGLYYSKDAGQTWYLSTIEDGPNQVIQSSQTTVPSEFPGIQVTSVVWNPVRQMFFAAMQYHGYYQSADGVTWTRMTNQPGAALTKTNCPFSTQANSCAIFRGVLAVQPVTGDMFALTVGTNSLDTTNDVDEGLWQDVCHAGTNGCANPVVQFGRQIPDAALDDTGGNGTIPLGTYNLTLAAVPNGTDTLLFAGTQDIFRCSLAAGCEWRNTTNVNTCVSGKVALAEHAIASLIPAGQALPLLYFGNDSGLWRSTDGVNETGAVCSASDATHFQNLNGGLGSLAEVTGLANGASDANALLAGFGVNGSAGTGNPSVTAWPQLVAGEGGETAIDPVNPQNWYASLGSSAANPYVAIGECAHGTDCSAADFALAIGSADTAGDESLLNAPYILDPNDSGNLIVGTCRVWRGPATGGWNAANAISPMLDNKPEPSCNGNALIRSLAASGANVRASGGAQSSGSQSIYAGMAGLLDGGGSVAGGDVFATQAANTANDATAWTNIALSPVANEQSYGGVFNPYRYDVSSLYADPHDPTGHTIYSAIQGFGAPHLYLSTDGGADWTNITQNLPDLPLNDVLVDPNNASVVYVASDGGVFVTQNVANCEVSGGQCWNVLGTGLPLAPAVKLAATGAGGGLLRVGTYGRGIWQVPLLSGIPQTTMKLTPTSLTFSGQPVETSSSPETVTVTNTGSVALTVSNVAVNGDFLETDNCTNVSVPAGGTCQIQVRFAPSASGPRTGTLTVSANVATGQQSVVLSGTGTTQSALVILPSSVDFGGQPIQTTSVAQQVTISNSSGSSIPLSSENVTGPFAIQINTCSGSLPANTGCTLAIVFTPTQAGPAIGTLTVVSGQGTQTIGLSGNGENPATDTLAPLSLTFPSTQENSASVPQTVTLTNSGGAALTGIQVQTTGDFAVVNGCGYSLNANSACTLTVRYTPHAVGVETGSILVTDALRVQSVSMTGTGTAPPTATLSPTSINFPATVIGRSASAQTVTLANSGDSPLGQLGIEAVGAGFGESNNCGTTLTAHSSCTITATYQAMSAGPAAGQVVIDDALGAQLVLLSASGETPAQDNLSPLSLAFGTQAVGTASATQTVTLSNNGQATLARIALQSSNADFRFTTICGATLQPGSHCGIAVAFAPQATGAELGTLTVTDVNRTQKIPMSGTGVLGNVTLAPGTLNFGNVGVQIASAAQTLRLTNGSPGVLTGIAIATGGPFTVANGCGTTLPAGGNCTLTLTFTPASTGEQNGSVTVTTAETLPMQASLTGTGIAFQLLPTSPTSISVTSGNTASYSLELEPTNGSVGTATITCANLPPNATCSVNPPAASLTNPTNIQVAVATGVASAAGIRGGSSHPARLALSGIGLEWWCWLLAWLPLWELQRRRRRWKRGTVRLLAVLLAAIAMAGISACGKGIGPLTVGVGGVPNPLPTNSLTLPGTYTVTVTATAGGLQQSVALTVEVH